MPFGEAAAAAPELPLHLFGFRDLPRAPIQIDVLPLYLREELPIAIRICKHLGTCKKSFGFIKVTATNLCHSHNEVGFTNQIVVVDHLSDIKRLLSVDKTKITIAKFRISMCNIDIAPTDAINILRLLVVAPCKFCALDYKFPFAGLVINVCQIKQVLRYPVLRTIDFIEPNRFEKQLCRLVVFLKFRVPDRLLT